MKNASIYEYTQRYFYVIILNTKKLERNINERNVF